jgi:hypothetical protein
VSTADLEPAPTVRDAKNDHVLRLIDYLNKKWARASAKGEAEVTLRFPTALLVPLTDALRHMLDHRMPLYRLHVDVEEHSRAMLAEAAVAELTMKDLCLRATCVLAEFEALLDRKRQHDR